MAKAKSNLLPDPVPFKERAAAFEKELLELIKKHKVSVNPRQTVTIEYVDLIELAKRQGTYEPEKAEAANEKGGE